MVASLLLVAATLGSPQGKTAPQPHATQSRAPEAWPIASIRISGNKNYSEQQILAVAGLRTGQIATPRDFEAARDRLAATGAFESIEFRFGPAP
ncbi:MAG: POTRA domain-containing protein, partial [Bryobacteraceae bacterium]